jgi:hypothetical protein
VVRQRVFDARQCSTPLQITLGFTRSPSPRLVDAPAPAASSMKADRG